VTPAVAVGVKLPLVDLGQSTRLHDMRVAYTDALGGQVAITWEYVDKSANGTLMAAAAGRVIEAHGTHAAAVWL